MQIFRVPNRKPLFGTVEIDWGQKLTRGLFACFIFNEGAGAARDLVRGEVTTVTGTPGWTGTSLGIARDYSTAGSETLAQRLLSTEDYTSFTRVKFNNLATGALSAMDTGTGGYLFLPLVGGTIRAFSQTAGQTADTTTSYTTGRWYSVAMSQLGTTALKIYQDGVLEATTGSPAQGALSTAHSLANYSGLLLDGQLSETFWYRRALDDSEVAWLHYEPYTFLRPRVVRYYSIPTSGATGRKPVASMTLLGVGA